MATEPRGGGVKAFLRLPLWCVDANAKFIDNKFRSSRNLMINSEFSAKKLWKFLKMRDNNNKFWDQHKTSRTYFNTNLELYFV